MGYFLICSLLITMTFVGSGRGISTSMSCSYVNGVRHCTQESGSGNVAMSSSMAGSGPGRSYSSDFASTGDSNTGTYDSSKITSGNVPQVGGFAFGGMPGGVGFGPPLMMDPFQFVFGNRGFGRR